MAKPKQTNRPAQKKATTQSKTKPARQINWKHGFIKLCITGLVAIAGYMLYLDGLIIHTFDGERWQSPARVFARPLSLTAGMPLTIEELKTELNLKGYQRVNKPHAAGQYAASATRVAIWLNAVDAKHAGLSRLWLEFDWQRLAHLSSRGQSISGKVTLAPMEVDRITSSRKRDRLPVTLDEIPDTLISALLLVEDRNFFQHAGVAPSAIARAFVANIRAGHAVQGGSTLTQQLAKNLFLTRERSLTRKIKEAFLALIMDFRYSKERLLETYLNEIYMGQNGAVAVHGFGAASEFYFGKPLRQLSVAQQAMLVAMVKGPSLYNPWRRPEKVKERRDLVLRLLVSDNLISRADYESSVHHGLAIQPKSRARLQNRPAIVDLIRKELAAQRGLGAIPDTLSLYTSLSPTAQQALEGAVSSTLPILEKRKEIKGLQVGAVVLDSVSGQVKALVGDRHFSYAGFNRALHAYRPIGSLIKPFIVLAALESGEYHLASQLNDRPVSLRDNSGKRWQPQNYDRRFRGSVSMEDALQNSLNVPFVNLGMQLGLDKIKSVLTRAGLNKVGTLYPSSLLGSVPLSPLQVAQLYASLTSNGYMIQPHLIYSIQDANAQHKQYHHWQEQQRFDSTDTYLTNYALMRVPRYGTAKHLGKVFPRVNLAGKTGTTNDLRDSWYVGFDERDLVVIWVGRDDNQPTGLTGSSGALRIYENYLKQRGADSMQLPLPADVAMVSFNQHGVAVSPECESVRQYPIKNDPPIVLKGCDGQERNPNDVKAKSFLQRLLDLF